MSVCTVFWESNMYFNETSTDVLLKDLMSLEFKTSSVFPQSSKHQKLLCYSRVGFLTCLFVWASDELIGTRTDWLLLREGGNFSVILWLIIAPKYVTVPTPSEVFDRRLWCVFTQAGRQTDSYLAPTPREVTQVLLTVCCRRLYVVNRQKTLCYCGWIKRLKNDSASPVITACLLETVRVFYTTCVAVVIEDWTDHWREYLTCNSCTEM